MAVPADKLEEYQREMGIRFDDASITSSEDEDDVAARIREDSPAGKG